MSDLKIGQTVWVLEFKLATVSKIYYEHISNIEFIRNNPNIKLIETKINKVGFKHIKVEISKTARFDIVNDFNVDLNSSGQSKFKKVYFEKIDIKNITIEQLPKSFFGIDKTKIMIGRRYK